MYRSQSTRSLLFDCLLILVGPALVILTAEVVIFAYVARTEDIALITLPVPFLVMSGLLALLMGGGGAVAHWAAGPGMVRLSPEEEMTRREEIRLDEVGA